MAGVYGGSRLFAQPATPAGAPAAPAATMPAPAQTRVAFVNIAYVFQKYEKAKFYKTEMDALLKPYKEQIDKLKKDIESWVDQMKKPDFPQKNKEWYEQSIVNHKRKIEDLNREAQGKFLKQTEQQTVQIFKEVKGAVQAYAMANGYHIVLAYAEPIDTDPDSLPNINRKVQGMDLGGGVCPMFFVQSLDISRAVTDALNRQYPARS
jgi:Skp family chaperone for outer membrane proteins